MKKMKYSFLGLLLSLLFFTDQEVVAQDIIHGANATETIFAGAPARNYFDDGGDGCDGVGSYSNSANLTTTMCPDVAGQPVTIEFLEVDIETRFGGSLCWDFLNVHDGPTDSEPLLFRGCGEEGFDSCPGGTPGDNGDGGGVEGGPNDINASASNTPPNVNNIFTSTHPSGCITVNFDSDSVVDEGGWTALVSAPAVPGAVPVPTMGQWGFMIFCLLMLIMGMVIVRQNQMAFAGGGQSSQGFNFSLRNLPFDRAYFTKALLVCGLTLIAIFAAAIALFGYELTNADVPGSLIALPLLAYVAVLLKGGKE